VVYSTGFLIVGGLLPSVFVTKLRQPGFSSVVYSPMFGNDVTFTGFLSWFTPRMFDSDVAFTGFLSWFTPRMFDYGVAFTGFPRVVYSPILFSVLHSPVVFTWFAPRVISNGIRILNVDSDLGLLFRKWRGVDLQRPPGPLWF
jgi:hypothetical protein